MTAVPIDIGIDEQQRAGLAAGLSRVLADTYTLDLQTHNFHGNVTGPYRQFAQLTSVAEPAGVPASDHPTLDVLTNRMETHEKNAWMLRSLLA